MRRLPPLNPLRAFEAAARNRSMSKAAEELFVSHGAVSHQVRALEQSLDITLFVKGSRPLKLTTEGAMLLPTLTNAFREIAATAAKLTHPTAKGMLTVACVPGLLSYWLMPRLSGFLDSFPEVSLKLIPANTAENLTNADVDLCILYGDGNWPENWVRLWCQLEFFPVVSPTLLANRPLRSSRDLKNHVVLHGDSGREWKTWISAADPNEKLPERQHFFSDARISTEAALHGHGVAIGDSLTARDFIANGELVAPFDLSVPANFAFYLACREEARETVMVRIFIDWMLEKIAEEPGLQPKDLAPRATRRRPVRARE